MCDCIGLSTSHRDHSVESERRSEEQGRRRKAYRGLHQHAPPFYQGHGDAGQCAGPGAGSGAGTGTANSETGPGLGYTHAHGTPQGESAVHGKNAVGNSLSVRPGARFYRRRPELLRRGPHGTRSSVRRDGGSVTAGVGRPRLAPGIARRRGSRALALGDWLGSVSAQGRQGHTY